MKQEKILEILKNIKEKYQPKGVEELALFGSFATQKNGIYSDIDIAIKKNRKYFSGSNVYGYFTLLNQLKMDLSKALHRNVDIFDLDAKSSFSQEIEKDLIYV